MIRWEFLSTSENTIRVRGVFPAKVDFYKHVYEDWHGSSVSISERRNKYSYLSAKVHDDALRESLGNVQVTFARAAIMTAPIFTADNQCRVYLPKGLWRDLDEPGMR